MWRQRILVGGRPRCWRCIRTNKNSPWPPGVNSTAPLWSSLMAEWLFKQLLQVRSSVNWPLSKSVRDTQRLSDLQVPKQECKTPHELTLYHVWKRGSCFECGFMSQDIKWSVWVKPACRAWGEEPQTWSSNDSPPAFRPQTEAEWKWIKARRRWGKKIIALVSLKGK